MYAQMALQNLALMKVLNAVSIPGIKALVLSEETGDRNLRR